MPRLYLNLSFAMLLITYICAYRWYAKPTLRKLDPGVILQGLLLLHCGRFISPISLMPGATLPGLAPEFSYPQAYGDFATALFALVGVKALRSGWRWAVPWVWFLNIFGSVDLLYAAVQAVRYDVANYLGSMFYVIALYVPLLVLSHIMIFRQLSQRAPA